MYKNLSEMAAHKKGLWSEVVVPKNIFFYSFMCLIAGNSFFQSTVFPYFTKVVTAIHSLMDTVFIIEERLQPWINYIQRIWQILLFKAYYYFKRVLAAIYLNGTVIISGGHLQWSSIFNCTVFLWNKHLQSSLFSRILS